MSEDPPSVNRKKSTDHDCKLEDLNKNQEYLDCCKIHFENRLKKRQTVESSFHDFIIHKTIGMGAFGRVMLVNHKSDPKKFLAMKVRKLIVMLNITAIDK